MKKYLDFIESKKHVSGSFGFDPDWFPDIAFDFQKYVIKQSTKKGRNANFLDTGLGKTLINLSIAYNIVRKTNRKVLILTPLAVAFQFLKEAEKIGIDDIEYTKDGNHSKKIVVCNYERLHLLNSSDFEAVFLDESSILKNFNGKIKNNVTSFVRKVKFRQLFTATPSPNDFTELGTSSEVLGYLGYMDMLGKYFKNNQNSVDSNNRNIGEKWYLKPHAEKDFFEWVNSWSVMCKMPSDLGFSDEGYNLPELIINKSTVKNQSLIDVNGQIQMFTPIARTMTEVRHEQKQTVQERSEKAVQLADGKTSVYWVNRNDEGDLIESLDSEAVQIRGSQSIEKKEELLMAFADGEIKRLITKAKMTGMGLNWQHCNHTVFFPTWSYEQYYQAIRRFWRFGQKKDVTVDLVISDGQQRVIDAIQQKTEKARMLYENLILNTNKYKEQKNQNENQDIITPKFLNT